MTNYSNNLPPSSSGDEPDEPFRIPEFLAPPPLTPEQIAADPALSALHEEDPEPPEVQRRRVAIEFYRNRHLEEYLGREQAKAEIAAIKRAQGKGLILTDLSAHAAMGVPEPSFLCEGMLYAGGLHSIAGPPDGGKTSIALHWAVQLLQAGQRVLFLDEEGGPDIVTEKMLALGADIPDLTRLSYCAFPGMSWTEDETEELCALAADTMPAMVLVDSSAAFMARAGLDENAAPDVTNFWSRVLTPLARNYGAAVLVIDHDTKATEGSRYARGSGAKLAAIDVQFKVEIVTPFTRHQDGELKLHIPKDRRGYLWRDWQVVVRTGGGQLAIEMARTKGGVQQSATDATSDRIRSDILRELGQNPGGLTGNQLKTIIVGRAPVIAEIRDALVRDGKVTETSAGGWKTAPKIYRLGPWSELGPSLVQDQA